MHNTPPTSWQPLEYDIRRGVIRWLIREATGCVLVALSLFVPAGRWGWGMGWALVAIYAAWTTVSAILLIPRAPELLIERAMRRRDTPSWDKKLLSLIGLSTLARNLVAGLDLRYGWSCALPDWARWIALALAAAGYALVAWAMVSNAFFAAINRIQVERDHHVVTGGPYRFVRHPAYTGTLVFELLTPLMLGSWWALLAGGVNALLLIVRTALEDRMLHQELPGYRAFAERTRYRLLPGVW